MLWDKYNPDDFRDDDFPLIPEGNYRVRIENAEEATSHAGNNMIKLTLAVSGYNTKIWYYLVLNGNTPEDTLKTNRRLNSIFSSFDIVKGNMHLSDWRGCVGGAKIIHEEDNFGKEQAKIQYFLYRNAVNKLPAWQERFSQGNINPDMMDFDDSPSGSTNFPF